MRLSVALMLLLAGIGYGGFVLAGAQAPQLLRVAAAVVLVMLASLIVVWLGGLLAAGLDPAPQRARGRRWWRLLGHEALAFGWAFLLAQPLLAWFMPQHRLARGMPRGQLLLVHGFVCNRGLWWRWRGRLAAAGFHSSVIDLPPLWWSMPEQLRRLQAVLAEMRRRHPQLPIHVIGHSMGGLAGRMLPEPQLAGVVCLGAPHHGTVLAGWFGLREHGPPLPDSGWLQRFNGETLGPAPTRRLNLWSVDDAIVVPASSSALDADDVVLQGYGHMGLSQSLTVLARVLDWLQAGADGSAETR